MRTNQYKLGNLKKTAQIEKQLFLAEAKKIYHCFIICIINRKLQINNDTTFKILWFALLCQILN